MSKYSGATAGCAGGAEAKPTPLTMCYLSHSVERMTSTTSRPAAPGATTPQERDSVPSYKEPRFLGEPGHPLTLPWPVSPRTDGKRKRTPRFMAAGRK